MAIDVIHITTGRPTWGTKLTCEEDDLRTSYFLDRFRKKLSAAFPGAEVRIDLDRRTRAGLPAGLWWFGRDHAGEHIDRYSVNVDRLIRAARDQAWADAIEAVMHLASSFTPCPICACDLVHMRRARFGGEMVAFAACFHCDQLRPALPMPANGEFRCGQTLLDLYRETNADGLEVRS